MNALSREDAHRMLNKVPEVTLYFWIINRSVYTDPPAEMFTK